MLRLVPWVSGFACLVAAVAGNRTARAESCDPGRATIVLDRSSSMVSNSISGQTRWQIAKDAIQSVTGAYPDSVEFGLLMFPDSVGSFSPGTSIPDRDRCISGTVDQVEIPAATGNGALIATTNNANPPDWSCPPGSYCYGSSYTPLGETLSGLHNIADLQPSTKRKYVILVTDGRQDCDADGVTDTAGEKSAIAAGVTAVKALKDERDVRTFVVGFGAGSELDIKVMNNIAVNGGTAPESCRDNATTPCFFLATNADALVTALMVILEEVDEEICDGKDNDCDDLIDEGLDPIPCGNTYCPGTSRCLGAAGWSECDARDPVEESCSTPEDDDCDGAVNEGCGCDPNGPGLPCGTETGECKPGLLKCKPNGQYDDVCEGEIGPSTEICDGKDNDCDGQIDEAEIHPGDDYPTSPCSAGGTVTPPADDGGNAAGCACEVGGGRSSGAGLAGILLMLGLAFVVRRKR